MRGRAQGVCDAPWWMRQSARGHSRRMQMRQLCHFLAKSSKNVGDFNLIQMQNTALYEFVAPIISSGSGWRHMTNDPASLATSSWNRSHRGDLKSRHPSECHQRNEEAGRRWKTSATPPFRRMGIRWMRTVHCFSDQLSSGWPSAGIAVGFEDFWPSFGRRCDSSPGQVRHVLARTVVTFLRLVVTRCQENPRGMCALSLLAGAKMAAMSIGGDVHFCYVHVLVRPWRPISSNHLWHYANECGW